MVLDREIEYHWLQLWKAIIGLLDFLGGKLDELTPTAGIEELLQEVMLPVLWLVNSGSLLAQSLVLLDFASTKVEAFLSSPEAIHEFIVSLCVEED